MFPIPETQVSMMWRPNSDREPRFIGAGIGRGFEDGVACLRECAETGLLLLHGGPLVGRALVCGCLPRDSGGKSLDDRALPVRDDCDGLDLCQGGGARREHRGRICIAFVCPSFGCGVLLFFYGLFESFGFADPLVGPEPLTTSILEALWIATMGAVMLPVIGFPVLVPLALLTVYSLKWFERMMAYFDDGA